MMVSKHPHRLGFAAMVDGRTACGYRYRDQRDRPDLTNPDSLQLYLETRFEQLRVRTPAETQIVMFLPYSILSPYHQRSMLSCLPMYSDMYVYVCEALDCVGCLKVFGRLVRAV